MDQQRATFGSDRDSQAADPEESTDGTRGPDGERRTEPAANPVTTPRRYR